jgi:outer membrane protein TolC
VASANGHRRAARWLAGVGLLTLTACSAARRDSPERLPPPPFLAARSPGASPGVPAVRPAVVPAAAQVKVEEKSGPRLPPVPSAAPEGKPLPIDLPTALALSGSAPLDIQIAGERLRAATAQLDRAKVLWLPNINLGVDYFRHDGQIQDIVGDVFTTSRSSFLLGAGPGAVFSLGEARYAPLAARQVVRAREADLQASRNDVTLQVAEAYFNVQQARGEVAGSLEALRRAEELVRLTEKVAPELAPTLEINRAKAEAARRRQAVEAAYERWQTASADLARVLRLEPGTLVEPAEEPALVVELVDPTAKAEGLIPVALTNRPELAADQAVIQAALARLRLEQVRPFVPTIAVRGVGSNTPGLAGGYFGGGVNDDLSNFGARFSVDVQAVWELQNLGFGNRAAVREREAEQRQALLQLIRTQDRVTAEVVQALAQVRRAANRVKAAGEQVAHAAESADKNLRGLMPGKRIGDQLVLVIRPQEAVAAVAALDQAYRDYFAAVGDHNRAQFRLYRALGHPAHCLTSVPARPADLPSVPPANDPKELPPIPRPKEAKGPPPIPPAPAMLPAPAPTAPTVPVPEPAWRPARGTRVGR